MKATGFNIIFICIILFLLGQMMLNDYEDNSRQTSNQTRDNIVYPQSNRPVDGWDYTTNSWRYKDQVVPIQRLNKSKTTEPYPDYWTKSLDSNHNSNKTKTNDVRYVVIDGKRYYINYRSNGTMELTLED